MSTLNSEACVRRCVHLLVLAFDLFAAHVQAKLLSWLRSEKEPCARHLRVPNQFSRAVSHHTRRQHFAHSFAQKAKQSHVGLVFAHEQSQLDKS